MNIIIPQIIAKEIIFKCIGSLSSNILSSYNFYYFIISNTSNDYQNYQQEIISTDLANKLLISSSLIKDIIKKYHFDSNINNISIETIIKNYNEQVKIEVLQDEEFNIISHIQNNSIITNIPEPVKISIGSTLEIIEKINSILELIHLKIKSHSNSFIKYIKKIDIKNEVEILINYDKIFEKRLNLLFEIIKIYNHVIK